MADLIGYEPPAPPHDDADDEPDDTLDPAQLLIALAVMQSVALIYGTALTLRTWRLL